MPMAQTIDTLRAIFPASDDRPDAELISKFIASRDELAFAELARRHGPMIYGTCSRILQNRTDAEDAFQATFFILARKANAIQNTGAVGSWLHGVAVRVAQKARQQAFKRRMRQMAAAKPEQVRDALPNADFWLVIDEELTKLPELLRQAILTCDVGGKSRSQAAKSLGWPEGTVAKRLAKAREELRSSLSRRGIAMSIAAISVALSSEAIAKNVPIAIMMRTIRESTVYAIGSSAGSLTVQTLAESVMRGMKLGTAKKLAIAMVVTLTCTVGIIIGSDKIEKTTAASSNATKENREADPENRSTKWVDKKTVEVDGWEAGSLAYSPDGKMLLASGIGGRIVAYDRSRMNRIWESDTSSKFSAITFSLEGDKVYCTTADGVKILEPQTGRHLGLIRDNGSNSIAIGAFPARKFAGDGAEKVSRSQVITGNSSGYLVKGWSDSNPEKTAGTIQTSIASDTKPFPDPFAIPIAVDPLGRSAIITGPIHQNTGKNVLWAYVCGNYEKDSPGNRIMEGHDALVVCAAWSKNGKVAVTGDRDGRVILWDATKMKQTARMEMGGRVASVAISANGSEIAAALVTERKVKDNFQYTEEVRLWETKDKKTTPYSIYSKTINSDFKGLASIAYSPDEKELAVSFANMAHLDRLNERIGNIHTWKRSDIQQPVAKQPEDEVERNQDLWVWSEHHIDTKSHFHRITGPLKEIKFSKDEKQLFVSAFGEYELMSAGRKVSGGTTIAWDTKRWLPGWSHHTHADDNQGISAAIAVAPDGKTIAMTYRDGYVRMISTETGQLYTPARLKLQDVKNEFNVQSIAISPDGNKIAYSDGFDVLVRDFSKKNERTKLGTLDDDRDRPRKIPATVSFSPDGNSILTIPNFKVPADWTFDPNVGLTLMQASKKTTWIAMVWGPRPQVLKHGPDQVTHAIWSGNGKRIATADAEGTIVIWDAENFKELKRIKASGSITAIAFRDDGTRFAIGIGGTKEKAAKIEVYTELETDNWLPLSNMGVPKDEYVSCLAFTKNGKTLVAGTAGIDGKQIGRLLVWHREKLAPK